MCVVLACSDMSILVGVVMASCRSVLEICRWAIAWTGEVVCVVMNQRVGWCSQTWQQPDVDDILGVPVQARMGEEALAHSATLLVSWPEAETLTVGNSPPRRRTQLSAEEQQKPMETRLNELREISMRRESEISSFTERILSATISGSFTIDSTVS